MPGKPPTKKPRKAARRPGSGKSERYIQPTLLLALMSKPSYGYELIQDICRFGFIEGQAPPGMVYRHLRDLEENGLVVSEWQTEESGPAKRIYELTPEGSEVLSIWIEYMGLQANRLSDFIDTYRRLRRAPD